MIWVAFQMRYFKFSIYLSHGMILFIKDRVVELLNLWTIANFNTRK